MDPRANNDDEIVESDLLLSITNYGAVGAVAHRSMYCSLHALNPAFYSSRLVI